MPEVTQSSFSRRPVPAWFHDAKLGIFVHWGLYSVPAWAPTSGELGEVVAREGWAGWFARNPYAEWYMNSIRIPGSPSHAYHVDHYGPNFSYEDFVPLFNRASARWDPEAWADLFAALGARYVVLTAKHHDGFLLWPSQHPNPFRADYCATRDLVGELTWAVRRRGLRMGLYYSGGLDWTFNPKVIQDLADIPAAIPQDTRYVAYALAHWRELIDRYGPAVLWNDIAFPAAADLDALFTYYYRQVPDGVVNDRFTQRFVLQDQTIIPSTHHDFRTPEYASFAEITQEKWEATRGIGFSFGYNQNEGPEHHLSVTKLIHMFVDVVSKNGNMLLNVGPTADGTIPALQRERLEGLGQWLAVNGEAIFGSRPWRVAEGETAEGIPVRYTRRGESLYVVLLGGQPGQTLHFRRLHVAEGATLRWLGSDMASSWQATDDGGAAVLPSTLAPAPAYTLCITPVGAVQP